MVNFFKNKISMFFKVFNLLFSETKNLQRPPTAKKNAVYPYPQVPISSPPMMLPMTAAEEKKLRLLENASREAKSRKAEGPRDINNRPASTRFQSC